MCQNEVAKNLCQ